jgi:AraC family transcriptional regulator
MEPKFVELGPLCLLGLPYYGNPEGGAFGQTWERFNAVHEQVTGKVDPKVFYGLEVLGPETETERKWMYMPAVEVRDLSEMPMGLFGKTLPACMYAVFTAAHGLASIPETFTFVMEQWLPNSGYEQALPFDFELYDDDRFHGDGPNEEIDIYIPVRKKTG